MCPFNKCSIMITWITFFIKYSNRAKYKKKICSFWSSRNFEDRSYSWKFCRKTAVDVPFETESWIEKNTQLEKKLWTLYSNPVTKNLIFDIENVGKIRELWAGYSYVQSLQVIKVLPSLKTQITQQNLPSSIERLQCIFIESFCIAVLAVFELSKAALDEVSFFKRSCKQYVLNKTAQFRFQLLQKCNLRVILRDCEAKKIRFKRFPQKNVEVQGSLKVYSFINRVLQRVLLWGVLPISKFQSDNLFFRCRSQKSILQSAAFTFRKLLESEKVKKELVLSVLYSQRSISSNLSVKELATTSLWG